MKRRPTLIIFLIFFGAFAAAAFAAEAPVELPSGLVYQDLVVGTGETAEVGAIATIHVAGWLDANGQKDYKFFDSRDQGRPVTFKVGTERVMKAWNLGVPGMKVGGKRRLIVPAQLGYGDKGVVDTIPPGSDLILEIELLEVR